MWKETTMCKTHQDQEVTLISPLGVIGCVHHRVW